MIEEKEKEVIEESKEDVVEEIKTSNYDDKYVSLDTYTADNKKFKEWVLNLIESNKQKEVVEIKENSQEKNKKLPDF